MAKKFQTIAPNFKNAEKGISMIVKLNIQTYFQINVKFPHERTSCC